MLDSEQWRSRVIADSQTLCPACQSTTGDDGRMCNWEHDGPSGVCVRRLSIRVHGAL